MSSSRAIIIIAGIILYQAFILLYTDTADGSIAMHSIIHFFGNYREIVPIFLFVASGGAIAAIVLDKSKLRVLLLFPQHVILFIYAEGALDAMLRESYADNVLRTWTFISTDQVFLVAIFVINSMSIIDNRS